MSIHHQLTALSGGFGFAAPAVAHVSVQAAAVDSYTMTAARLWGSLVALLGVAAVVLGGMALSRAKRGVGNRGRNGAVLAGVFGLIALVGGVVNLAVADGGPGTGNGVVAGGMALVFGPVAVFLSWRTLARARRSATD